MQAIYTFRNGDSFVYPCNDAHRFILNLLFTMSWLTSKGCVHSFNGPAWSIPVEAFLYGLFFLIAYFGPKRTTGRLFLSTAMIIAGMGFYWLHHFYLLGLPVLSFYSGGLAFIIWSLIDRPLYARFAMFGAASLLITIILATCYLNLNERFAYSAAFPVAVSLLAAMQKAFNGIGRHARILGDISYSTYLPHFPIQIVLILTIGAGIFGWQRDSVYSLGAYVLVLVAVSTFSFYFFERPTQKFIRNKFLINAKSDKP